MLNGGNLLLTLMVRTCDISVQKCLFDVKLFLEMLGGCALFPCNPHTQVENRLNMCMNATEAELSDHADAMLFSIFSPVSEAESSTAQTCRPSGFNTFPGIHSSAITVVVTVCSP